MTADMREDDEQRLPCSPLTQETGLRRALELVNFLISTTYLTRSFPVKWQLIRDKLEQLSSVLSSTAGNVSDHDSSLAELLQAIVGTAGETQFLAQRCSDESYSGGKLQLRSDLDVVTTKLELHIKHLAAIYASGLLSHSRAIILSKPGAGASRDDMRFYVKDIFSRLRIGGSEVRARALASLNEILGEDDKYVRIVVVDTLDGVTLLVSLLEFGEMGIQDEASEAVSVIAGFDCYRGALVMAGAITQLVRVLEMGSGLAKERAARALVKLTENSNNAWSVSAHGGVTVLLKISSDFGSSTEFIGSACDVLRNLSGVSEIKRFMVEQGVVSVLAKLSKSKEESTQIQAIEFMIYLAFDEEKVKQKVVSEGVIDSLLQLLDPSSPSSSKAREVALRAIEMLFFSSPNSINILIGSEFLNRVLFFLRNGDISVQESALKLASRLCVVSEEAKKAMGDAGFMLELVNLLEARSFEVREMAAEALCKMVSIQRNRRRFIQEDHNVNRILQLLDPEEEKSVTKKSLLSVLMSLTESHSGRRKLAASWYVKNLEKLAATEVIDAKKIIKKLTSSRFRSMLNGIWSS